MKIVYIVRALLLVAVSWHSAFAAPVRQQIAALATTAGSNGVVVGKDGWLFLQEELEHLGSSAFYGSEVVKVSKATKPEFADPLPVIVDFNNQLKERGITLVFMPVPPKALIYPDMLPGNFSREMVKELSRPYEELYGKLAEQGVQVLDLIPLFNADRDTAQVYCKTDTHFSGQGLSVSADAVSKEVKQASWYAGVPKKKYSMEERTVDILGDLSLMDKSDGKESLPLQFVIDPDSGKNISADPDSPVLLLGDSHTLVFSVGGDLHTTGAGLFDQLSADLGFAVDLLGVRGSGATPSRIKLYQRSRKNPDMLAKKKVIIWCLSARELTGSGGWRKIPVAKK
jgi:alginate O-acetyltransferase complex protein AlgJ